MVSEKKGCWTCRVRRKRCDGKTPHCDTCDRLGIDCAGFGTSRPSWMDGGAGQRAYCSWLKDVVKLAKRQQSHTRLKPSNGSSVSFLQHQLHQSWSISEQDPTSMLLHEPELGLEPYQTQMSSTDPWPSSSSLGLDPYMSCLLPQPLGCETETEMFSCSLEEGGLSELGDVMFKQSSNSSIAEGQQHQYLAPSLGLNVPELDEQNWADFDNEPVCFLLMKYFDYTMQRLFPFHCPAEHVDERGCMLRLAHRSSAVRTALISATLHDTERLPTPGQPQDLHSEANIASHSWLTHYHRASRMILFDLETLLSSEKHTSLRCRHNLALEVLVSLVHILLLDLVVNDDNATTSHFKQGCRILEILASTAVSSVFESRSRVETFFTSIFLRWLVFRRTARPREPSWSNLTESLQNLPGNNVCGFAKSLLQAISQVADLSTWKTRSTAAGVLSTLKLAKRAHAMEAAMMPFVKIDNEDRSRPVFQPSSGAELTQSPAHCHHRGCSCYFCSRDGATTIAKESPTCPLHTDRQTLANTLLAYSIQIYLHMVVSGPNPRLLEIQTIVRESALLLQRWETDEEAMGYMALSWPLTVITSMALDVEERDILSHAATASERLWAYPSEQGHIEIGH